MFSSIFIFGREIGLYPIMLLCGIFSGGIYACAMSQKKFSDYAEIMTFILLSFIGVIVGSYLLYVLVNYQNLLYVFSNIDKINTLRDFLNALALIFGGNIFYGGLLGGVFAGFLLLRRNSSYKKYLDIIAVGIPLFHFSGRIGCFLGGCCYGIESTVGFTFTNSPVISANDVTRFPVQLLEAAFNLCLFLTLHYFLMNQKFKNKLLHTYLIVYAAGRFFIEFLRGDSYRVFWFNLSTSQIISVLIVFAVLLVNIFSRHPKGVA